MVSVICRDQCVYYLYYVIVINIQLRNVINIQLGVDHIDMYLYLDSASVVMVEAGSTSHFRMAAMLNGPT